MFKLLNKLILPLWILVSILLLLYSFTQVDLSLTLSQVSIWQGIQKAFQYVGYFNRPLSTTIYLLILGAMFAMYLITLKLIKDKLINWKVLIMIIVGVSVVLFISYNAFSYDLFNYIFDAKIVTFYHSNPYIHRALDYPSDPMLSFMHWTHRTYPYGPIWLLISIPLSLAGLGYFIVTFYLFKLIMVASFILSVFAVRKIAESFGLDSNLAVAAFALNPLVLIECLVSAHNDIVMMMFGLFAVLSFIKGEYIRSSIVLLLSIFLKFATVILIPAIILKGIFKISTDLFIYTLILCGIIAVVLATYRTNFQPWYLLYVIPFAALAARKYFVMIPLFLLSIAGLLQYLPYLYLGNWDPPVPIILNYIMLGGILVSVLLISGRFLQNKTQA